MAAKYLFDATIATLVDRRFKFLKAQPLCGAQLNSMFYICTPIELVNVQLVYAVSVPVRVIAVKTHGTTTADQMMPRYQPSGTKDACGSYL